MGNLGIKAACVKTATMIMAKINSLKGEANGFASLDANGRIPSSQLPGYVDGVTYEDVTSTVMQNERQFDAERYEELVEEYNSIVPEKTDAEKISDLQEGNAALQEQLETLDGTLTCILEEVLPSVMAGDGA